MTEDGVTLVRVGPVGIARVSGEIDLANAGSVGRNVDESTADGPLIIDLSDVTYIDSAGIGELFALAARRRERGCPLVVVVPDESPIRRLFKITQFHEAATICPTDDDALASLTSGLGQP